MDLRGKKALITGGSSGLGKATAQLLKERGAEVAITGRGADRLQSTAAELGVHAIQADVAQAADVKRSYDEFLERFGGLDILINNAGLAKGHAPLTEVSIEDMQYVYSVNVFGAAMMAQQAARLFKEQKSGQIVNIASTAALKGYPGGTIYSSSKFALRGMTYSWQAELRKYNVRVMLVNPSYVPTAFGTSDGVEKPKESGKLTSAEIAHAIVSGLEMDDRGFIPELSVWATNPYNED
jgi:3-oxoacyl-[acyl-carrier protein] reductase